MKQKYLKNSCEFDENNFELYKRVYCALLFSSKNAEVIWSLILGFIGRVGKLGLYYHLKQLFFIKLKIL